MVPIHAHRAGFACSCSHTRRMPTLVALAALCLVTYHAIRHLPHSGCWSHLVFTAGCRIHAPLCRYAMVCLLDILNIIYSAYQSTYSTDCRLQFATCCFGFGTRGLTSLPQDRHHKHNQYADYTCSKKRGLVRFTHFFETTQGRGTCFSFRAWFAIPFCDEGLPFIPW